ncbi:DHH family protein [Clostridium pasteurianum DSM 525 = ATCC 6013]|uniref:Cyclic-di-AMP phosphodiesterase n=1 Tax=Clostridium pasteurianum DSM 525 = ATCC 6013 TaxID=1262449 RepID=A0A0H3J869_CLOPA|nr:DHH family phosphoesterase [Clostridium pasteurianum]AJA50101.1 DHH family protein [Clostridium pasteurianum DSM 525 = ATCC 6013]AJA54089.1 DHH family protein [Clostridium pasteurianum DSM 525 = ATCC 6013]AOZ77217.1 delta-lactam-biosynthetic de-N-acetylase [Clostridium pasteurianum DSM 525 = ATCC 6013]AOZ81013.1 delta-lactam-biosynthetic de-N-acetylase [Clostridium pasteurianum]ELP59199.1 signaling protein [Clostridium pasteurianum DSM 525 = ATCC 6013]
MKDKYNYFYTSNFMYIAIIAVFIIIIFLYNHYTVGFIALLGFFILTFYNIKNIKIKKNEWKEFIEDFSSKLDSATKNTLVKLPFPLMIINNKGNILWYNQNLSMIVDNRDVLGKKIDDIIKNIHIEDILTGKKNNYNDLKIHNKYYDMYASSVSTIGKTDSDDEKDNIILLYFYDVSVKHKLLKEIENIKESVVLIEVDNLDEVVKSTPEDKRPLLIAEIERNINSYAQSINAMLKKYSLGKYVLVVQNKNIEKEMKKNFEILDIIREINTGNTLAVTLSIGIGRGGETPSENYNFAASVRELALSRGGDQAIIKSGDKMLFYGGKTKEVEKRTKVRARIIGQSLVGLVKDSSNVVIMGHSNPDIDCFGGAIGIYSAIRIFRKESYILIDSLNDSIEYIYKKLKKDKDYANNLKSSIDCEDLIDDDSLLILVDVNNSNYVENTSILKKFKKVVIIDHHRKSANVVEDATLSYIEPYASSTSELITEMVQYMSKDYKMKPIEAEVLLAGICVDTKNFYFKTGVRTFEAAAYLRKNGADTIDVKKLFSTDLENYIKKSEIIKSAKIIEGNIAIAVCPEEVEDNILAAKAADELLNIKSIEASFVLVKIKDMVFISGRSFGNINVQLIMESLGGGGHMTMAGSNIKLSSENNILENNYKKSIEYSVEKLEKSIKDYLRKDE